MKIKNLHVEKLVENYTVNIHLDHDVDAPDDNRKKLLEVLKNISNGDNYICIPTMSTSTDETKKIVASNLRMAIDYLNKQIECAEKIGLQVKFRTSNDPQFKERKCSVEITETHKF